MALGGGTFTSMNKKLPGTYINFVSASKASANLSDRGYVTMPLELNWGEEGKIFTVTQEDFIKKTMNIFGYSYDSDEMKGLRELFKYAQTAYLYRLNGGGTKASCAFGTATCAGTRGNDLKIVIAANVDDDSKYDVTIYMGTTKLNSQTVATAADLVDDDFVAYDKTATLAVTAGTSFTGGTNETVSGTSYSTYFGLIEAYTYNVMGIVSTESTIKALASAFVNRMRDQVGQKFQVVLYNYAGDYEGIINLKNTVSDTGAHAASLVYWLTGVEGACAVNASCTNKLYDGEYTVSADYTQSQLEAAIDAGELVLHRVGDDIRILTDIDSLVTTTDAKGDDFKSNQTIRVLDQIANDIAVVFATKYLGRIPNDADGRTSLWGDIVKLEQELENIRAIEDFDEEDVEIAAGDTKKAVVVTNAVTPVNAMEQLYMTVNVQ